MVSYSRNDVARLLALAGAYLLLARLTQLVFGSAKLVNFVWIANAVALAAICVYGRRLLPAVFFGVLLALLAGGQTFGVALTVAVRHTAAIFLGVWVLQREGRFDPGLSSLGDYARIFALALAVGLVTGMTWWVQAALQLPYNGSYSFLQRLAGTTLSILLFMPLLLVWRKLPSAWADWRKVAEAALILGLSLLVGQVLFLDWFHDTLGQVARGYWMYLFITLAAMRLGAHGTVLVLALTGIQGLLGANWGLGFFADDLARTHLANYFYYMLCLSAAGMALATYFAQRKQAEARLEQFFVLLPDLVCIATVGGRFLKINPAWMAMLGYSEQELLASPYIDFVHPEDREATYAAVRRQLAGEQLHNFANRYRCKDGSYRWLEWRTTPAVDQGLIYATARDFTDRMRLEQEREQYFKFFALSTDAMCIADPFGCFKQVNPAFIRMLGFDESELLAKPFLDFIHPEDRQRTADEMKLQVSLRPSLRFENRFLCKDASVVHLSWTAYFDGNDGVTYATARDVTDLKNAEEALRQSEARFRQMFEGNDSVMFLIDQDSLGIIDANAAASKFYGYPIERLKTLRMDQISALPAPEVAENLRRIRDREQNFFVTPHRLADGSVRSVETRSSPIQVGGRVLLFSIVQDITEHLLAEETLRQSEERLRLALAAANQAWFDANLRTGNVTVSPEYPGMIGFSVDEFRSNLDAWLASVHPEDRPRLAVVIEACLRDDEAHTMEYRRQTKSGEWKWIRSTGKIVERDDQGQARRMIGIHTDISERKRAELALMESEAYSKALFAHSDTPLVVMDPQTGVFIDCNEAAVAIYQLGDRQAVLGKTPLDVATPSQYDGTPSAEAARSHLAAALAEGRHVFEWRHRRPSGEIWDGEVHLMSFRHGGRELIQFSLRDVTEQKLTEAENWRRANFDALTGLTNRSLCRDRLERAIVQAQRSGGRVGVLFVDLDGFKGVNDTLGHASGDDLLKEAAKRLGRCVREQDTVARFGGDEFLVVAQNLAERSDLLRVADQILGALNQPFMLAGASRQISCSVGISVYPDDAKTADRLIDHSDKAMYRAKRMGKNQFRFYADEAVRLAWVSKAS